MRFKTLLTAVALSACAATAAVSGDFDPYSANIEENIATPSVSAKASQAVGTAMSQLAKTLRTAGYSVDIVRKGEVVLVTIPCSELFGANSVELKKDASKRLLPLVPYIKRSDNFKVILAVHSDNTGDELYAERLTADRANAIDEFFFQANEKQDTGIIPYGLGADEPVAPNTGVGNRARNRRVEIYFVPTQLLIEKTRKH